MWHTLPSQKVGKEVVVYVRQYYFSWHLICDTFSNIPLFFLIYHYYLKNECNHITISYTIQSNLTVNVTYIPYSANRPRDRRICPLVLAEVTFKFPQIFTYTTIRIVSLLLLQLNVTILQNLIIHKATLP